MAPREKFVCDTSALINLHMHFRGRAIRRLRRAARSGTIVIPEGVQRELERGTDKLGEFVRKAPSGMVVKIQGNTTMQEELSRLAGQYTQSTRVGDKTHPDLRPKRKTAADTQVIAVAKVFRYTAVSDDKGVQLVCCLEGVPCISWCELARKLGLLDEQPSLLQAESDAS